MEHTADKMLTWVGHIFTTIAAAAFGSTAFIKFEGAPNVIAGMVQDPVFAPLVVGALMWGGVYLRDRHVRKLVPIRCKEGHSRKRPYSGLE